MLASYDPYKFMATAGSGQSLTANTIVKIQCGTKTYDTDGNYDNTTNFRFTAPSAGFYIFSGFVTISIANNNEFNSFISKNGVAIWNGSYLYNGIGSTQNVTSIVNSPALQLAANDYVELYGSPTVTVTVQGAAFSGYLHSVS